MPNPTSRHEILAMYVISLFQNKANISLFQHENATIHTARDTLNFPRANNIAFVNDWHAKSPNLNPIEHIWDNMDQRVRRGPIPSSSVIQLRQALECNSSPDEKIPLFYIIQTVFYIIQYTLYNTTIFVVLE